MLSKDVLSARLFNLIYG
ncbi:protein YchT [Escherichia coli]|nr:protein YchT [Escherichia coli]